MGFRSPLHVGLRPRCEAGCGIWPGLYHNLLGNTRWVNWSAMASKSRIDVRIQSTCGGTRAYMLGQARCPQNLLHETMPICRGWLSKYCTAAPPESPLNRRNELSIHENRALGTFRTRDQKAEHSWCPRRQIVLDL